MRKLKFSLLILISLVSLTLFVSCDNDSSTESEEINTAPIANFTINPESGTVDTEFSFDASSSSDTEDENEALKVRFDFDNDGNFETAWTTEKTATYKYDAVGTYSVKLEVRDSGGLISEKIKTVVVRNNLNAAPVANFIVNPESGTVETEFSFDASASSDAEDEITALNIRWDFDNDSNFETAWTTEKTATHKYDTTGTYSVKLEVKDSGGLVSEKIKTIIVATANTAPVANFTVNPESGTVDTEFSFDASASSDTEDDISSLNIRWDFDGDGNFETAWTTEKTANHKYDASGTYSVKLEVKDSGGLVSEKIKTIIVATTNTAPVANFIISPETGTVETEFLFDASASSDAEDENENLLVRWDFDGDGNFETAWTSEKTATYKYDTAGTYSVKLEVKDSDEMTSSLVQNLVVEKPTPEGMVLVVGGSFEMGNVLNDSEGYYDEKPVHEVSLNSFYISKYEITNAEYCVFLNEMGNQEEGGVTWINIDADYSQIDIVDNKFIPKSGKENYPVFDVTWYGARAYCEWKGGRLPTEAEWEYAARGGQDSEGYKYAGSDNLNEVAWYDENSEGHTHFVGKKKSNELGIYDMSGNVYEWCNDWYSDSYYGISPSDNPTGPSEGYVRVLRGGSWLSSPVNCRLAYRYYLPPDKYYNSVGFRLILDK